MEQNTLYFTDFEGLVFHQALEREWKLLDIVTAQAREAGDRDGWALARIKVRAVRRALSQTTSGLPWTAGRGRHLSPEDEAALAEEVAAVGQKMKPPRAELEKLMTLKARRRAVVRRAATTGAVSAEPAIGEGLSETSTEEPCKLRWTAPKCE